MNQEELNKELFRACQTGNLNDVKKYIAFGAEINHCQWLYGDSPIEIASSNGHLSIVEFLSSYATIRFYFSIQNACEHGHLDIVKYLYSKGVDPTDYNNLAISNACAYGHLNIVKYLYAIGCNPNRGIISACECGQLDVVRYLISIGCDPTDNNNKAIKSASLFRNLKIVKYLALIGCDISEISMRKEIEEWLNEPKLTMDRCLAEIYGNPRLERTKTENEIYFKNYVN